MPDRINICLVDDDADDHVFFKEALQQVRITPYNITSVYNGVHLLQYLNKLGPFKDSEHPLPDVIIMDLNMPIMNGTTALKKIKAANELKDIPTFILSTTRDEKMHRECKELGCVDYYVKPVTIQQLATIIEDMLYKATPHY